jgi:phosphodiesterase/alkaline phosphatase D-like protein
VNRPRVFRYAVAVACVAFAAVGSQVAVAASSPSATTGTAQAVSTTSATLTGAINPQGQDTMYHFEYGTTTAYGTSTTSSSAGNGTSDVSASAAIGSLTPNTTYHYRLVATYGSGSTNGTDMTVTTSAVPPSATTGAASGVSSTSATLTGAVNPQGQRTTYDFEYGTSTAYGSHTPERNAGNGTSNVSASAGIGSLTPNTTYHYRLVATNGSGPTNGADRTFTTAKRPAAASTGTAKSVTSTAATLTGALNPEGQPTTYYFEYGRTTAYGTRTGQTSAGSGTSGVNVSAAIGSLSPRTGYHYRLVATNGSGTTLGADRTLTTAKPAPPAPSVSTRGVDAITTTSARLAGAVNPNGAATHYYFQYGTTTAYGGHTRSRSAGSGTKFVAVQATIGGLSPGTAYHYRLLATSPSGTAVTADRTFTSAGPSRVTLAASPGTLVFGQSTTLAGTVFVTSGSARTTVTLQRSRSAFGPFAFVANTTSTSSGAFAFSFGPYGVSSNWYFRAVVGGRTSAPVRVAVRFRVGLFVSAMRPRRGQLVRFHGLVHPPRNGRLVALQRFGTNHRWNTIRLPRLRAVPGNASAYSVFIRVRRNGLWRVIIGPGPNHARGFSRVLSIRLR